MRIVPLTSAKGGINRMRDKGSAKPDSLYDALNCWVTPSFSIKPRPGTVGIDHLPASTVGLTAFRDRLVTFANEPVDVPYPLFELVVIRHPTIPTLPLLEIHFAEPFLGYLYVAAEFSNGDVFHYWLQPSQAWQANTVYLEGTVVTPTVPNGFGYIAQRQTPPYPLWEPSTARNLGDRREPTTANGYYYEIIDIQQGSESAPTNVQGSATEPTWVAETDALVYEDVNAADPNPGVNPPTGPGGGNTTLPITIRDRYIDRRAEQ